MKTTYRFKVIGNFFPDKIGLCFFVVVFFLLAYSIEECCQQYLASLCFFPKDGEGDNTFFYCTKDILRASKFVFSGILETEVAAGGFPWASVEGVGSGHLQKTFVLVATKRQNPWNVQQGCSSLPIQDKLMAVGFQCILFFPR